MLKMVSPDMARLKYVLFIFNLIFGITGIMLILPGSVILSNYHDYKNFVDNWIFAAPALMITFGAIVFLVSFIGCSGAVTENFCMINTFSVLLVLILALEWGAGISGYKMRDEVGAMLESRMNGTMQDYNKSEEIQNSWNIMQYHLDCCGINGSADWSKAGFEDDILPISCCKSLSIENSTEKYETLCKLNSTSVREKGCVEKLQSFIEDKSLYLGGVGLGIAFIELLGVIFACILARSIRQKYEVSCFAIRDKYEISDISSLKEN